MQIKILGTTYTVKLTNEDRDPLLKGNDGYTSSVKHLIVLDEGNYPIEYQMRVLRHEIVHAFLTECGLDTVSWANNEEIVDWISLQAERLVDDMEAGVTKLLLQNARKETKNEIRED